MLRQGDEEKLEEFAERALSLATNAWGVSAPEMTESAAIEAFLHGLKEVEVALSVMERDPETMDDALEWVKKCLVNRRSLLQGRGKGVPYIRALDVRESPTNNKTQRELEEKLERALQKIKQLEQQLRERDRGGKQQVGGVGKVRCYQCQGYGHMARECTAEPINAQGGTKCYNCGGMGHFSKECPTPRRVRAQAAPPSPMNSDNGRGSRENLNA